MLIQFYFVAYFQEATWKSNNSTGVYIFLSNNNIYEILMTEADSKEMHRRVQSLGD